jgi:hypothetical protein
MDARDTAKYHNNAGKVIPIVTKNMAIAVLRSGKPVSVDDVENWALAADRMSPMKYLAGLRVVQVRYKMCSGNIILNDECPIYLWQTNIRIVVYLCG